ncbi:linker histone H1M [Austrofundulus limnaeus]|uniref:Linker histone H1M n=1 Tax=Austrofundulus limnaeus TaxID=52670 RepID=A0A2I4B2A5_AUSLI|nr:PREDICTED: histone H1-gamma, late-like [Austrofundulus limnaeus]
MPPKKPAADSAPQPTSSDAPLEEAAGKKKPGPAALRKLTCHPPTAVMVREALTDLDSRKGVSSQAIQKYIKLKYPSADGVMLKHLVRRALLKGLESGTLARPPSSTVTTGIQGRFRLVLKKDLKPIKENADPNMEKAPKEAKEGVKRPQKTGATMKKNAATEEPKSTKNPKPPKKAKKDEEPAPAKKPRAKKAEAKESGKGSSDSTKTKAKTTKELKTGKDSQSKAVKAAGDAPVTKPAKRRNK